jgi:hypothetical protein
MDDIMVGNSSVAVSILQQEKLVAYRAQRTSIDFTRSFVVGTRYLYISINCCMFGRQEILHG